MLDLLQGCMPTKKNELFRLGSFRCGVCCVCSLCSLPLLEAICVRTILSLSSRRKQIQCGTCSISQGGKSTVAAGVLWFAAAVGTALLHPSDKM
jgi:hypothetical protein